MKMLNASTAKLRRGGMWLALWLALVGHFFLQSATAADSRKAQILFQAKDGWLVRFEPSTSTLECFHKPTGTRLSGQLSFTAVRDGKSSNWQVHESRDYVSQRLALLDEKQDAQGYVTVAGDATHLDIKVLPRPPHLFSGELVFLPRIDFGKQAFACRTLLPSGTKVVQMASGDADSLLNDSLFDLERDIVLRFGGKAVTVSTECVFNNPNHFTANLAAAVETPEVSSITIEILPDYYRSHYVPKYKPIDRKRCPTAPSGWMSWNVYFDTAGEKENLDEARVGAKYLKPFGLEIWSIESWQDNSPRLPVSDFYNLTLKSDPVKFPHGMKWLAGEIRALGFRPGIWAYPWGTGDEKYYHEHQDWFLHDAKGKPMSNWSGRYLLDPSQKQVRRQMEESFRMMSADWGYEFFKIDGMSGRAPNLSAHFFERPEVRAAFRESIDNPYPACLEALRRGIGPDRIFLACQGHYTGPEIGLADAGRLGADIVHPNEPPKWEGYFGQFRLTQAQLFTLGIVWYGDPDTLLVGKNASLDVARFASTVVGLPGQLTFFGDKLAELAPERMRLLQQVLPVCDVRPLDLFPNPELKPVWDLKLRRPFASWDVVSVFNWTNQPTDVKFDFADLGLEANQEYLVYDFWNQKFLGAMKGGMTSHVESHANVLLAVHANTGRPQFLSTDRHVSQGGVEWTGATWSAEQKELTCSFKLVENDPLTAVFHVPRGYELASAEAEGATLEKREVDSILYITLRSGVSGDCKARLKFVNSSN